MILGYPTYPDLTGKVALVTGGADGYGPATARLLAASGATVIVQGNEQATIDAVVDGIHSCGGVALGIVADCTDFHDTERMRRLLEMEIGPVEMLITLAGVAESSLAGTPGGRVAIDTDLISTFLSVTSFLPGMIERRRGTIVTVAAQPATQPSLTRFSERVAGAARVYGVRVNCVALTLGAQRSGTGTAGLPAEACPPSLESRTLAALFLASDASAGLSGITLNVAADQVAV